MSKPGLCCDSCFSLIAKRSAQAATLWLDLCDISHRHGSIFGLKTPDFPILRLLETLGFIISTETPEYILVKMQGEQEDSVGTFYCGGKCEQDMQ